MGIKSIAQDFKSMPHNVKICVYVMPLWAVPYNLVNSYASLYMLEQGVSATQVGAVNSISFIAKTIFALFAGYIVNRFGRRKSAAVLDFIGWAFPMLIYFFATTYWQFLLAAVINCLTVINGIISQCFFTEDVEEKARLKSFNFNAIATSVCGFFVPLTGLFISRFGFLPAIRGLYLFAFFSMAAMAVCKFFLLRETSVGKAMMERREPLRNPVSILMKPLRYVVGNRRLVFLFSVNILINFATNINNLYFFSFLTGSLGFSDSFVSLFPFITTAISLLLYLSLVTLIRRMAKSALFAIGMYLSGAAALIASFYWDRYLALLCVVCWAVAGAVSAPVLSTLIANTIDDSMRTDVLGVFNVFSMLCMFPAGYFGGWLYEFSPLYPIFFIFAVYLLGFSAFLLLGRKFLRGPEA